MSPGEGGCCLSGDFLNRPGDDAGGGKLLVNREGLCLLKSCELGFLGDVSEVSVFALAPSTRGLVLLGVPHGLEPGLPVLSSCACAEGPRVNCMSTSSVGMPVAEVVVVHVLDMRRAGGATERRNR